MSDYGVQPTGFIRKPISVILAEEEAQMITEFGPGVIQTSQSPLGQINGLMADLVAQLWEFAEDVYQSYDPDQAEGTRLETLARIRLVDRASNESDVDLRQAITNKGTARVTFADFVRAVQNVDGVYYAQVFVNETPTNNLQQMPPNTISVAALGGDDDAIADAMNPYITPGISTYGNHDLNSTEDGYCRPLKLIRPVETATTLEIQVRIGPDRHGCPAAPPLTIASAVMTYITAGTTRPWNGQTIDAYYIRSFIESNFPGVQYVNTIGHKAGVTNPYFTNVPFAFFEIADVTSVTVTVVT